MYLCRPLLLFCLVAAVGSPVVAVGEQLIPIFTPQAGADAAADPTAAGLIDYLQLLNRRDGGVDGVRLNWEACDTALDERRSVECFERLAERGAALAMPLSDAMAAALGERSLARRIPLLMVGHGRPDAVDGRVFPFIFPLVSSIYSQAAAQIRLLGHSEGSSERLRGKRIAYVYLDQPANREALLMLDSLAGKHGFELVGFAVAWPGRDAQAVWQRAASHRPDWILLAGAGALVPAFLRAAAAARFPAQRIVGFASSSAEQDVRAAGRAAVGYLAATLQPSGANAAVVRDIARHVHGTAATATVLDAHRLGSTDYLRGVMQGLLIGEALRVAHRRYGNRALDGEQMRWGLEHLRLDDERLDQLGALELLQPITTSCSNHEGGGAVKFQQWLGSRWNVVSDWVSGDLQHVREVAEAAALRHALAHDMPLRDCGAEAVMSIGKAGQAAPVSSQEGIRANPELRKVVR